MKLKLFFLVLVFALVWSVVLAPAHIVARLLPAHAPLVLQGFTGSVWSATVARVALVDDGQLLTQGHLTWQLRPLSVLRLSPCINFAFEGNAPPSGSEGDTETVAGVACVTVDGQMTLRDVEFDLPARRFLRSAQWRLDGEVSGLLADLTWQSGELKELRGRGVWTDAMIRADGFVLPLNALPFDLQRESSDSIGIQMDNGDLLLQQADTPLHISGQSTVALDGQFHTRAQLITQPQTPDELVELLNMFAEPRGAGVFILDMRSQP